MNKTTRDEVLLRLYRALQTYVGWTGDDAKCLAAAKPMIEPSFPDLIDDFYSEILRHPAAAQVITGGERQIARLKSTLSRWLDQLFCGTYGEEFVAIRQQVGRRHVEVGLDQAFFAAAISRLRSAMVAAYRQNNRHSEKQRSASESALHKMLDLDIAIINYAYQRHFAQELEENAAQQVKQSERLAAIGQTVTGLAHESRNVLQRSHACLETLILDIEDRPDALRLAMRIQTALDQLHLLYEEVRNYAAPIKLELGELNLLSIVTSTWQHLAPKWGRLDIDFHVTAPESCWVLADKHRIDQLFTNLLQNAIDACGNSGRVECSISACDEGWSVEVADNGVGIDRDGIERVFEPFFTTKSKGTGLGLAISKRIVDAHQGTIAAGASSLGGASFRVVLPSDSTAVRIAARC